MFGIAKLQKATNYDVCIVSYINTAVNQSAGASTKGFSMKKQLRYKKDFISLPKWPVKIERATDLD